MAGPEWFARMANPIIQNARNRNRLLGGLETPGSSPTSSQPGPANAGYTQPPGGGYFTGTQISTLNQPQPMPTPQPQTGSGPRLPRPPEFDAASQYFSQQSPEDQAAIRATWQSYSAPGANGPRQVYSGRQLTDWYNNALAAGSVQAPLQSAIAPLQSVQPNASPQVSQSNPLASLMQTISAAPTETYESMKAKYGAQAAREWERNQGR